MNNNMEDNKKTNLDVITSNPTFLIPWSIYGDLIKGKQTFLLVYTALFTFLFSAWEVDPSRFSVIDLLILIASLLLAVSGSTMLNMYIDRDIDAIMERTKKRALPNYKVHPTTVLIHGSILTATGILLSGLLNMITMIAVFLGFFFDVVVYSLVLKRRSKLSIIFGGIAGGFPAVAGRTAVIGSIDLVAVLVALFVIFWIPLHILTLALMPKNLDSYKKANIPMWPVVSGNKSTTRMITVSAIVMSSTIFMTGVILKINTVVLIPLLLFSLVIIYLSVSNLIKPKESRTYVIFKLASVYMAFAFFWLFLGMVITFPLG